MCSSPSTESLQYQGPSLCQTPFLFGTVSWPLDAGESWDRMGLMPSCLVILCPSFLGLCESQLLSEMDVWRAPKPGGSHSPNSSMWHVVSGVRSCILGMMVLLFASAQKSQSPVYFHPIKDTGHKHIPAHKQIYAGRDEISQRPIQQVLCGHSTPRNR